MFCFLLLAIPMTPQAAQWTGNINGFIGAKMLDDNDWKPLDEHGEIGVLFDFAPTKDFPVNIAIDLLASGTNETYVDPFFGGVVDADAYTSELAFGFRKYLMPHKAMIKPYIGAGVAIISAEIEAFRFSNSTTVSDDDNDVGPWLEGGVVWTLKHFNIGFDIRYSDAEVTLFGRDYDAGGFHTGLIAGYHW